VAGVTSYASHYAVYRGFPVPRHPAGVPAGKVVQVRFFSRSLGRERSYTVALPPGYSAAAAQGRRFPVLYMLHGTSGSPRLLLGAGAAQLQLDSLLAQHKVRPFIVVLPDGRDGSLKSDTEWANTAHGRYEGLVLDTVRAVDGRWSTVPDRHGRAIAGLSEGGYGALNIGMRNLGVFSVVESWSGYFGQSPTGPFKGAATAAVRANSPRAYVGALSAGLQRNRLHVLLYAGQRDPARKGQAAFARQLRAAGADVRDVTYPGKHDWRLWRAQMTHMLSYAGGELWRGR
jgi:enterochelin esterase-like enzyme